MTPFQWIVAPPLLGLAAAQAWRLARREVRRSRGLLWAFVWGSTGLFVLRPDLSQRAARVAGIGRGSDLLLYLALLAGLAATFVQYRRHRKLENTLTELVRQIAIENPRSGIDSQVQRPGPIPSPLEGEG